MLRAVMDFKKKRKKRESQIFKRKHDDTYKGKPLSLGEN